LINAIKKCLDKFSTFFYISLLHFLFRESIRTPPLEPPSTLSPIEISDSESVYVCVFLVFYSTSNRKKKKYSSRLVAIAKKKPSISTSLSRTPRIAAPVSLPPVTASRTPNLRPSSTNPKQPQKVPPFPKFRIPELKQLKSSLSTSKINQMKDICENHLRQIEEEFYGLGVELDSNVFFFLRIIICVSVVV
jgi:hypothetical protein